MRNESHVTKMLRKLCYESSLDGETMLKKIKILVPLDKPDILGVAHKNTPDYKLVFEESMNLAKALDAEVVLLHVPSRDDKEGILSSNKPGSKPLYKPEDLKEARHIPEVDDLIGRYLPKLELIDCAGSEVKGWKEGRLLEFELSDEAEATFRAWAISRISTIHNIGNYCNDLEVAISNWSTRLTPELQQPIQYLLARAGEKHINTRAMIMLLEIQSLIICNAAQEWDIDLIVMGRGKAAVWQRIWHIMCLDFDHISLLFDSSSTYVLHNAPCSIVLVDEHLQKVQEINKILVALDYSPTSREIFLQAVNLAERIRAVKQSLNPKIADKDATPTLYLLHVTSTFEKGDLQMVRSSAAWAEERNVPVQYAQKPTLTVKEYLTEVVLQPDALPGQVICETATEWGADLIVMGYRREWELKKLVLGSVCNYVTRHAPCSVFVVRSFKPDSKKPDSSEAELTPAETYKEEVSLPTNS
jgi:nucleotide-binding universal stress UspA family protein